MWKCTSSPLIFLSDIDKEKSTFLNCINIHEAQKIVSIIHNIVSSIICTNIVYILS